MNFSTRKRNDGRWQSRTQKNYKTISAYGKTKAEARQNLEEKLELLKQATQITETNLTVSQWSAEWLAKYKQNVKPSTLDDYETTLRLHVIPVIGRIKLIDLTGRHLQDMLLKIQRKGLSAKSVRNIYGVVHSMLDKAVKVELISKNVSLSCEPPRATKPEMHIISDTEVPHFLDAAQNDPFSDMLFVDLFTGLREAELIGLTWDCIDFTAGSITVRRQFTLIDAGPDKGKYKFMPLKNGKTRVITPPSSVMDRLLLIKKKQNAWKLKAGSSWSNPNNFVFTREDGRFIHHNALYRHLKKIVSSIGRPEVRLHDLRHTYATLSIQNGVDIKTLSQSMGHATVAFTLDVYGHVSDTMRRDAANKLERFIASI